MPVLSECVDCKNRTKEAVCKDCNLVGSKYEKQSAQVSGYIV